MRARMLLSLTLGTFLPCLGAGCASPAISGQGSTTTSGNKFLAYFMQPKAKQPSAALQRNDPTSLFNKTTKPGPELYVTMAQLREQAGDTAEAESLYQKALKADPKSLPALMGYAHLEDRRGNLEAATKLYKRAISKHPNEVAPYNDLGLCFHRQGKLNESAQTLHHAVELQPDKQLYHNNLAMVFVDLDRNDEALKELSTAGSPAAAHYNLASLLHRKGDDAGALEHFREALAQDPSMQPARQWVAKLAPDASPLSSDSLLAGRVRQRTRANAAPPASTVATDSAANAPPPTAVQAPAERPAIRPPVARPVSTRTVKSAPEVPASNPEAAPRAPTQPQFLYGDTAPAGPPTVAGRETAAAPPAPEMGAVDRLPPPSAVAQSEIAPPADVLPPTPVANSGQTGAPQAPNPPQFLYADQPPYGSPSAQGRTNSSAPPAPELAPADRLPAPLAEVRPEPAPVSESLPEASNPDLVEEPQGPNPPQFLYADETPYDSPYTAPAEAAPAPPVAELPDEKTKLSLASDRAAGARIIKPTPEYNKTTSNRGAGQFSLNPPLYLQADERESDDRASVNSIPSESLAAESVFDEKATPAAVEPAPIAAKPAGVKPMLVKPLGVKQLKSKPIADAPLPDPAKSVRLHYPRRNEELDRSTRDAAPLPGEQPQLDAAMSTEDEVENPALIVPAEPNHYDR